MRCVTGIALRLALTKFVLSKPGMHLQQPDCQTQSPLAALVMLLMRASNINRVPRGDTAQLSIFTVAVLAAAAGSHCL
jgi:hypothetical protein